MFLYTSSYTLFVPKIYNTIPNLFIGEMRYLLIFAKGNNSA